MITTPTLRAALAAEQAEPVAWPFRCGQRKLVRRGHAQGLLREMAAWMRRDGVGDCEAVELVSAYIDAIEAAPLTPAAAVQAVAVPAGYALVRTPITDDMHVAAAKVLARAHGLEGTPQRMLYAMITAAPPAPARQEWQPIETAPKDQFILVSCPSGYTTTPRVVTTAITHSSYKRGRWVDHANDDLTDWGMVPTHWMPLPAAPITAAPAEGEKQ